MITTWWNQQRIMRNVGIPREVVVPTDDGCSRGGLVWRGIHSKERVTHMVNPRRDPPRGTLSAAVLRVAVTGTLAGLGMVLLAQLPMLH